MSSSSSISHATQQSGLWPRREHQSTRGARCRRVRREHRI
jgi:hypothetical protein